MAHEQPEFPENDPIWEEARALEASIRAIRRAQGKCNPEDFPSDTPECLAAMEAFARDVSRVLALEIVERHKDNDSDFYGAGAAG
jgi:hypothetical protein